MSYVVVNQLCIILLNPIACIISKYIFLNCLTLGMLVKNYITHDSSKNKSTNQRIKILKYISIFCNKLKIYYFYIINICRLIVLHFCLFFYCAVLHGIVVVFVVLFLIKAFCKIFKYFIASNQSL